MKSEMSALPLPINETTEASETSLSCAANKAIAMQNHNIAYASTTEPFGWCAERPDNVVAGKIDADDAYNNVR